MGRRLNWLAGFRWSRLGGDGWSGGSVRASLWQTLVLVVARRLAGRSTYRDVLNRNTMWGDVVDLTWCGHVDQIVGLNLDLISRWQEGVKTHNEVWVAFEKLGHTVDDPRSVYALRLELFHNIKEIIINLWLIPKLQFHLIQIGQGIFNLQSLKLLLSLC